MEWTIKLCVFYVEKLIALYLLVVWSVLTVFIHDLKIIINPPELSSVRHLLLTSAIYVKKSHLLYKPK